jgi:hypothetical protein
MRTAPAKKRRLAGVPEPPRHQEHSSLKVLVGALEDSSSLNVFARPLRPLVEGSCNRIAG